MFSERQTITMTESAEVDALRSVMPDLYFINTPSARMWRHLRLLRCLADETMILDFDRPAGTLLTELTLCTYDDCEPGLLAKVCGTLSALRVDIHTAFIYTVRNTLHGQYLDDEGEHHRSARPPRWIVFDTFLLTEPYKGYDRPLSTETMQRVRRELTQVLQGRGTVEQLWSRARHRLRLPLTACSIALSNGVMSGHTRITLRTEANAGVLYRMANALAALDLNICVAQINTFEAATDDTFFVTDNRGGAIPEEELATTGMRLRTLLQDGSLPAALVMELTR